MNSILPQTRNSDMPEDRHRVLETRFNSHIEDYRKHIHEENTRWEELLIVAENNNKAIDKLTKSTQGLVDLQTTGQVLAKIGVWIKNVTILGGITWYVVEHLPK